MVAAAGLDLEADCRVWVCCAACFFLYLQSMTSRISDVEEGYGAVTEVQRPEGSKLGRFVRLA
ncbi:MAG: hypothetical protein ACPIOQ_34320, partial [Promethearchaeia archaeon]